MFKKFTFIFILLCLLSTNLSPIYATSTTTEDESEYTQLKPVYVGTFNEYKYKITDEFFTFRENYDVDQTINAASAKRILELAQKGYSYLPDSLTNKNYYSLLKSSIERGIKYPDNESNYTSIVSAVENYLEKTNIQSLKGSIEVSPSSGNAPLTTTFRGKVSDPTGAKISSYNYTWRVYENGVRKVIGDNISLTYTFKEEGKFSVFLDVKSTHKNDRGYVDVLPFSSRADVTVNEKIASVIIKVNSTSLRNNDELKFTPDEARYGLLFDATSSTPTSGAEFIKTSWDFGNGVKREYTGNPKVERVIYGKEGDYTVTLTLKTNELKSIEREFRVSIHQPIATINVSSEEGYLGDKFTFSAKNSGNDKNLSYSWEIVDTKNDDIIFNKTGNIFTYSFEQKGKYNVKMKVTEPSGEIDTDTKIIYINSRAPNADYISTIPQLNKPNRVFLDATRSYDPDFSDDGNLKFSWLIDGEKVELSDPNFNGSTGYYTFDSIGEHSVVLYVQDPDGITSQKNDKVSISSILSVDFSAFPRVTQRTKPIRFVAESPEARFYEWDFGDGKKNGGNESQVNHSYEKSGIYNVILKVRDADDNTNTYTKNVYIGDSDSPYSFISITDAFNNDVIFDESACGGEGAYVVNKVDSYILSGKESVNITGENTGLEYSWKVGNDLYNNSGDFTKKFDDLGCFPVKLTVKSQNNGKTSVSNTLVDVRNIKPNLSSINITVNDSTTDPVIVNLSAIGAQDKDGIIQSYLWYYYTDSDPEPQDFRSTKSSTTTFVLPKVTGNYYFVVLMKDNNEETTSSEDITGSKYFISLTGDNLNTPIIKLNINDSSVAIGDEITFSASVENILGQDLTKNVKYSWDFDGDGFYDKETTSNSTLYSYSTSGEKHPKVKVKYKGFSNTKSLTVDVSNILKPDFGYISIGNKFIFFNTSLGTTDSIQWNLGDGTVISNQESIIHTYSDSSTSHLVGLRISEGTKIKSTQQKVVKNVKNTLTAKKQGLIVFSNRDIVEDKITLENQTDKVFIYLGESNPDVKNYVIDDNIEYDSDLNGGVDDDQDNLGNDSYTKGTPIEVELNKNKTQKIRLYITDSTGTITGSRDITIIKNYIEEQNIDLNSIVFDGVSESTKLKIEQLKEYVNNIPSEYKLKALMYVQKLKEEWNDDREKTNIILEFEGYISDSGITNADDIINLLESLLVDNQEDKSEKAITFNALKNLIPTSIVCTDKTTGEKKSCYDELVEKLETIKNSDDIDANKILGVEILEAIAEDELMTAKEKTDFKAILKTLVYGSVNNIPDDEVNEVVNENTSSGLSTFLGLLFVVFKWLFYIIAGVGVILGLYYIYYLIVNKDKNIGFQDFIIEKTSGDKHSKKTTDKGLELDILNELNEKDEEKIDNNVITKPQEPQFNQQEEILENIQPSNKDEGVPDWLKGSFGEVGEQQDIISQQTPQVQEEPKKEVQENNIIEIEEKPIQQEQLTQEESPQSNDIPDWLKGGFETDKSNDNINKQELDNTLQEQKQEDILNLESIDLEEKDNIPDWLKGSFSEENKEEKNTSKSQDNIPDWLKGSFSEEKEDKKDEKSLDIVEQPIQEEVIKPIETENKILEEKPKPKKPKPKKQKPTKQDTKVDNIIVEQKTKESNKSDKVEENTQDPSTELWDDGMKVPDWLKTDDEK